MSGGAASAAYQIEGVWNEDGKGPSIWDVFCRKPSAIRNGESGDVVCVPYHRYKEDVGLMKAIGLHAYRLSVSWSRVLPQGTGLPNPKGLDFYERLVDKLLAAGITPYIARHLLALQRALSTGVDLRGYFHWSLLDTLEWVEQVNQRFGLVHADFLGSVVASNKALISTGASSKPML